MFFYKCFVNFLILGFTAVAGLARVRVSLGSRSVATPATSQCWVPEVLPLRLHPNVGLPKCCHSGYIPMLNVDEALARSDNEGAKTGILIAMFANTDALKRP